MATQVILVRHGVTDWNEQGRLLGRSDVPLNERGQTQAASAGEAIAGLSPGAVFSSPQRRTLETAEIVAGACGLEPQTDERLAEVWLRGWQGKTFAELHDDPGRREGRFALQLHGGQDVEVRVRELSLLKIGG